MLIKSKDFGLQQQTNVTQWILGAGPEQCMVRTSFVKKCLYSAHKIRKFCLNFFLAYLPCYSDDVKLSAILDSWYEYTIFSFLSPWKYNRCTHRKNHLINKRFPSLLFHVFASKTKSISMGFFSWADLIFFLSFSFVSCHKILTPRRTKMNEEKRTEKHKKKTNLFWSSHMCVLFTVR